jgi:glutaminase
VSVGCDNGIEILLVAGSWEYVLANPIVRKIADKTILNKFVCKGINTIFVKCGVVFDTPNL